MTEKIYIYLIEGSEAWIPVDVEQLNDNEFKIKSFEDFDPEDTSLIPQFIPGDIVTKKLTTRKGEEFWTADKLLKSSDHKDKKYMEFLYRIVTGDKLKDEKERNEYEAVIIRTRNEIEDGIFHFPTVVNYVHGIRTV